MLETDLDDSRVSRAEALARRLEARILDGGMRAGDRVGTKEDLRERFGVAVATVNEAIRLLQARGLVQVRPGPRGGVFASEPSPFVRLGHQVLALKHEGVRAADCLQVRDALEPVITVEAASFCSPADAADLRGRMERMQAAAGDPTAFLRANWDLHRRIADITPNRILRNLYVSLLDATESELGAVIPDSEFAGTVDGLLTLHREVVAAIVAGDHELARRTTRATAATRPRGRAAAATTTTSAASTPPPLPPWHLLPRLTYISASCDTASMHAFDVLGEPVRRRILELLAGGERTSGAITAVIQREFGISQPAVSQHLRVLRDSGFATVRAEGTRRLYAVDSGPLQEVDLWLERFRGFWNQRLDALATELARGRRQRGGTNDPGSPTRSAPTTTEKKEEQRP